MNKACQKNPKISVIIPVYNVQDFIQTCIESILNQTFQDFEIICISDGSEDESVNIIQHIMLTEDRIRLIEISNHGQGYARNLALNEANGEYVLFVDADDWIEPLTMELTLQKAMANHTDMVVFDWRYYYPIGLKNDYTNIDLFYGRDLLYDNECLDLLKIKPIFVWHILYRKSFLNINGIRFLEGYIYEDAPFLVKAILSAKVVSLIHSPLYRVTVNNNSSTKTKYDSDWHSKSFIVSTNAVIEYINSITLEDDRIYYLYRLLLEKFINYCTIRTPRKYRKEFILQFCQAFAKIKYLPDLHENKLFTYCINHSIWKNKRVVLFHCCIFYRSEWQFIKRNLYVNGKHLKNSAINRYRKLIKKLAPKKFRKNIRVPYSTYVRQSLYEDIILFMGFDYRYTGNSRYLYEELRNQTIRGKKIFFVTNDPRVPFQYRIEPNSERCDRFVARSKIIIFESWIPAKYTKHPGAVWIQLWHGTPFKKLLFDSCEKYIFERNLQNKNIKYRDIQRWDYLLSDNPNVNHFFETCFLIDNAKIISCGYPRVKYLLCFKDNDHYKRRLKENLGISQNKKIILYVPTWRDYNYKNDSDNFILDYLLNLQALQTELGDSYEIIYKDHPFLSAPQNVNYKNYCDCETQELLLIADYLITDYSSVMFDAFAINIPVILYCNDFEHNQFARGVYDSMWKQLKQYNTNSLNEIKEMIDNYKMDDHYEEIKAMYCYQNDPNFSWKEFLENIQ